MRTTFAAIVLAATVLLPLDAVQPSIRVTGGISPNGISQPLLFTWRSAVTVSGSGFAPGETVRLVLEGPLDDFAVRRRRLPRLTSRIPGRQPLGNVPLGSFTADAQGNLGAAPTIPYDSGIVGPQARITKPGYYQVLALGSSSGWAAAADAIAICPDTRKPADSPDWGTDRGARDGVFPDPIQQYSPERMDPEWPSTWSETPVELYGAVTAALISHTDNPPTHYAHDSTFYVTPDPAYRWLVATSNYFDTPGEPGRGTLEVEWETQNGGSTSTYAQGNIGLPLWANPTVGDRVYAVGRWILDAGHPEEGDRTEMHPPRALAVMRGGAAGQVDIYVSGHGGGANWSPPGLSAILDQGGYGGGRIRDVLTPSEQAIYYRAGPLNALLIPLLSTLVKQIAGVTISGTVYPDAGPSAFPWGAPGPEFRPVNDLDYDFDVPLPAGLRSPRIEVVTHAEHTTAVNEQVTVERSTAHIHIPFRGADNGIYARTLKFSPTTTQDHYVVRLNRIDTSGPAGKWQMWADVGGQWRYLGPLDAPASGSVALSVAPIDVFVNAGQPLRVSVHGYRATCIDDYFGKLFGQSSYSAGLTFVAACGPIDNQDLGEALATLPASSAKGSFTVPSSTHFFSAAFTVE